MKITETIAYYLPVNPEPWTVGSAYVRRGGGKSFAAIAPDKTLRAYQDAIRAELMERGAKMLEPKYILEFYFWRQNARYQSAKGRTMTRNTPDVTNMQKATEDALQDVLIDNDRNVVAVVSHLVDVSIEEPGRVAIVVHRLAESEPELELPVYVTDAIAAEEARQANIHQRATDSNMWSP